MPSRMLIAFAASIAAPAAFAQPPSIVLESRLFVETFTNDGSGTLQRQLKPAVTVTPGDRLIYVLGYRNIGRQPASDFVIINPLPQSLIFDGEETTGAEMSVDGGTTWGALPQLKVRRPDGTPRPAARADVTHIRWRIPGTIAAGSAGQVTFRAKLK